MMYCLQQNTIRRFSYVTLNGNILDPDLKPLLYSLNRSFSELFVTLPTVVW